MDTYFKFVLFLKKRYTQKAIGNVFVTYHLLSVVCFSNGYVQVAALDVGVMQRLVTTLSVDGSLPVRKKSLFALSTLVRQFPYAQKRFLDVGGLSALAELFSAATDDQLKIKIITLLTDLLVEYVSFFVIIVCPFFSSQLFLHSVKNEFLTNDLQETAL